MNTIARNNLTSNPRSVQGSDEIPKSNKNYILHESQSRTLSKSVQSKLKNLAYTLSLPFRSLTKAHMEKSLGIQSSKDAMKNINTPTASIRKTGEESTGTPKKLKFINTANGPSAYQTVGGNGGYRSTLAERLWG